MVEMIKFYSFLGGEHPPLNVGHNGLAGVFYCIVFTSYIIMILTGLALYSVSATGRVGAKLGVAARDVWWRAVCALDPSHRDVVHPRFLRPPHLERDPRLPHGRNRPDGLDFQRVQVPSKELEEPRFMSPRTPVLVLGLGNVVCSDDGAGIAAIHKLIREYEMPEGVSAVDGGTLGLSLAPARRQRRPGDLGRRDRRRRAARNGPLHRGRGGRTGRLRALVPPSGWGCRPARRGEPSRPVPRTSRDLGSDSRIDRTGTRTNTRGPCGDPDVGLARGRGADRPWLSARSIGEPR